MTPKQLLATAFGKIMIAGEYSVLFGGQSLVLGINRQATCTFDAGDAFDFWAKTQEEFTRSFGHQLINAAQAECAKAGFPAQPGTYAIDTSTFFDQERGHKLGLGSSSAATTALCKAILLQHNVFDPHLIGAVALKAHRELNGGFGSGADIAAAVFGGLISYRITGSQPVIESKHHILLLDHLVLIDTGHPQSTKPLVEQVLLLQKTAPDFIDDFCVRSSALCEAILTADDFAALVAIFDQLYHGLKELGERASIDIVSKEHAHIHNMAKSHGGSAKPSGAGGGDIALAIVPGPMKNQFVKELAYLGFKAVLEGATDD